MKLCDMCGNPESFTCSVCDVDLCKEHNLSMNHQTGCAWAIHITNDSKHNKNVEEKS